MWRAQDVLIFVQIHALQWAKQLQIWANFFYWQRSKPPDVVWNKLVQLQCKRIASNANKLPAKCWSGLIQCFAHNFQTSAMFRETIIWDNNIMLGHSLNSSIMVPKKSLWNHQMMLLRHMETTKNDVKPWKLNNSKHINCCIIMWANCVGSNCW